MVSNLSILGTHSETLESEKYIPPWMTPEFLYRINYGPTTEKEVDKVRKFLIDQYRALEARRKYKTMSHPVKHQNSVCRIDRRESDSRIRKNE